MMTNKAGQPTGENARGTRAYFPWLLWVILILLSATSLLFLLGTLDTPVGPRWGVRGIVLPIAIVFGTVGALVASLRRHNLVGWLLLCIGMIGSVQLFADSYAIYGGLAHPGSLPGTNIMAWLTNWIWAPLSSVALVLLPALFPDGRLEGLPSKVLVWLALVGSLLLTISFAFKPGPLDNFQFVENPFGLGLPSLYPVLTLIAYVLIVPTSLAGGFLLVVRWRRSTGQLREQLKWIVFAMIVMAILSPTGIIIPGIGPFLFIGGVAGVAIAIGVAILRHRLFDIDLIIRRTVIYSILTGVLLLVFFGTVIVLEQLFATLTGSRQNELVTVISTLTIAALFVPLRSRVQQVIDRRFYRMEYDAQKVLERFAASARDETDLPTLTSELVRAVVETMHPNGVSLWLKPTPEPGAGLAKPVSTHD